MEYWNSKMKNSRFNMLIKASVFSNKFLSAIYCVFVIISTMLILASVSVVIPLKANIDEKINDHVSNREIILEFNENVSKEKIVSSINEIENLEHIEVVYRIPPYLDVIEKSGVLNDFYKFGFIHTDNDVVITSGRVFSEDETQVALVPEKIKDYNINDNSIQNISGESLVGKVLEFSDSSGNVYKAKVIGAYSSTDPLYADKEILISQNDLVKYTDNILENSEDSGFNISKTKRYIVLVDSSKNVDNALENVSAFSTAYKQQSLIDGETYTTALYILIFILVFFVIMEVVGFYILLKSSINSRTKELALYRALGYNSRQLFIIIFVEHLLLGMLSILVGVITIIALNTFCINPYIYSLVGNTIMEMTVKVTPALVLFVVLLFVLVLLIVCQNAVKRSEKIDLTILLRE